MKELYPFITKRKSTRNYSPAKLAQEQLKQVSEIVEHIVPLDTRCPIDLTVIETDSINGFMPVKAPYYLIISAEHCENYLTNVGFMGQQFDLHMSQLGIGTCWVGMARPLSGISTHLPFVIAMAFGQPLASPYREVSEFRRKSLAQMSTGSHLALESVRIAPSATNSQPWFVDASHSPVRFYRERLGLIKAPLLGKANQIDMGIAMCHWAVSCAEFDIDWKFAVESDAPKLEGYLYVGSL